MHGRGEFAKTKGSICNIPIKTENVCNILLRPADSNVLIVLKLKRDLKYRRLCLFSASTPICHIRGTKLFKNTQ